MAIRTRNTLTPREAQLMLDALARCRNLRPEGVDENTIICTHDAVQVRYEGGRWVHSSDHIADLRDAAGIGVWP